MSEISTNKKVTFNDLLGSVNSMSNKACNKIELLPHNQMLYDKIVNEIEKGEHNIFYSEATGLGKSFIFMRLVQDYFSRKKILYVVPKISIWKNLTRYKEFQYLDTEVIMTTYAAFNKYDDLLRDEYDAVFVDECHHMLSEIQGKNLHKFCMDMASIGKYSFGFTATPYYKGTYVDEACFDVSCYGYDVCEAIDLGLLPKIHFSVANIDIDSIPMDMRARYSITGTKTLLEHLLARNASKNKWIAYFLNKIELEQNVHELRRLFPDYTILKVYEGVDDEDAIYDVFNDSTGKVILLSVNKLLEGVHLKGVQGVLLYRNVTEFSTYMQMYGRLCDISAKESPIFLDVANACFNMNKVSEENLTKSNRCINRPKRKLRDFFDVHAEDYWTVELMDILMNSVNPYFVQWTQEEDDNIIKYYPSIGTDVQKFIPNKTKQQIFARAQRLGVRYIGWATEDFINKVKYCLDEGWSVQNISDEYGVAVSVVYRIMHTYLQEYIVDKTYSKEEDKLIIDKYNEGLSYPKISAIVNDYLVSINSTVRRTAVGISIRCRKLGIVPEYNAKLFTQDEIETLEKYKDTLTIAELVKLLPGRDYTSVYNKVRSMGGTFKHENIHELTEEQKEKCIELNKRYLRGAKLGVLADELGVGKSVLPRLWDKLGLPSRLNLTQIFSRPDNFNLLKLYWNDENREQIFAKEFPDVTFASILRIGISLGLAGGRTDRVEDEELEVYRTAILYHQSSAELVERLNSLPCNTSRGIKRNPSTVKQRRTRVYQQLVSEGYEEYMLSDCYTPEEDEIICRYGNHELKLWYATELINNLEINKERHVLRTKSSVASRWKDLNYKK